MDKERVWYGRYVQISLILLDHNLVRFRDLSPYQPVSSFVAHDKVSTIVRTTHERTIPQEKLT